MNTVTIKQNSRNVVRHTARNFRKAGKLATILDNCSTFKGSDHWSVQVVTPVKRPVGRVKAVKPIRKGVNVGFDIRPVTSGGKGYDLYLDGEFIIRRDSKLAVYEAGVRMAQKAKIGYSTLNYK